MKNYCFKLIIQIQEEEDYLDVDGQTALKDARKRAEQVGQQNQEMTDIAKEARSFAEL